MNAETSLHPPAMPPIIPSNDNSSMDEFEIKQVTKGKPSNKSAHVKVWLIIIAGILTLVTITVIVILALQRTGTSGPVASPTPEPTVVQTTAAPTPIKDLPIEWLNVENNINTHKTNLTKPNDERGKLSVPTINFETSLQE